MKEIIKLTYKSIFVMLPVIIIWIYTWSNPLSFMDSEAPYYLWNKEKTNTVQEKHYKTIILGDSTANAAYVPEILSDSTINLALGGTSPVENYYVLKDWLSNNQAPDTCYISFVDGDLNKPGYFWKRTMYSHRFKFNQNIEILKTAIAYKEPSIVSEHYIMDFISYELWLPNKYITSLMNAGFNQRYDDNLAAQHYVELHNGRYIGKMREYVPSENTIYKQFYVAPLFDYYYRKIFDLCTENNITVHIIKLPLPSNSEFTENYMNEFNNYYTDLKADYPKIIIDWYPTYDEKYFSDMVHMNPHGALKFSNELRDIYSADFKDTAFSAERIAALNSSIVAENDILQIINWISGKNYTLLINDASGKFKNIYEKDKKENKLFLRQQKILKLDENFSLYSISGINCDKNRFFIENSDNGILLNLEGQVSQQWNLPSENSLNAIVIDHYNNSIVCTKSFKYESESYTYCN